MRHISSHGSRNAHTCLLSRPGLVVVSCLATLSWSCAVFDALGGDDSGEDIIDLPPDACVPLPGVVVHLPFDEGIGDLAADISANGNDGRLIGLDDTDWVSGRIGTALDFDGIDDFVTSGSDPSIDDLPAISMCAWIQPRSFTGTFPAIADKSEDSFTGGWNFYIQEGARLGFMTNRRQFATGGDIQLGIWQLVCAVWDGSDGTGGISLYLDGSQVPIVDTGSNGDVTDSDDGRDLQIGRVNNETFAFDGLIDDYQLYSRVLTPLEIETIHGCADS